MGGGHLVFPVIMAGVILFVSGYVISTPATPAPEDASQRNMRIEGGDFVFVETTGYYLFGGQRYAYFSTVEEAHAGLPVGPLPPELRSTPVRFEMPRVSASEAQGLAKELLGRRVGDKFTTNVLSAAESFGAWEPRTVPRTLITYPVRVEFTGTTQLRPNLFFNATEYRQAFEAEDLKVETGAEIPCEAATLWTCRIISFDEANNRLVYERVVRDADRYPVMEFLNYAGARLGGDNDWHLVVRVAADASRFDLLLDPDVGEPFILPQALGGSFPAGTYNTTVVTADTLEAQYSATSSANVNPFLIGKQTQYDLEIVRIQRA